MNKVPKLRFPEFSGEWEEKKLGEIGSFLKGSNIGKSDLTEEGKPCILYGELYTKYGEVINNVSSKTNLNKRNLIIGNINDVLIPSSGETAIDIATASCLQQGDILVGGDLNIFRPYEVNGVFISYQLNNSKRKEIAKIAQGASVVHIYNNQLKKLKVYVANSKEQQKIGRFFSKIDKKIEKQQEKVNLLEEYKKGMMQKIFSQEIRFKDENGEEYPKWEEKKLSDYAKKIIHKNKGSFVSNVISNSAKNGLISQREFFNKDIANKNNIDGYYIIEKGDFVYNPRKSKEAPYGPINRYILNERGVVSPLYLCFKINNNIDGKFLLFYFKSDQWYKFIYKNSDQGVRYDRVSIKDSTVFKMCIRVPLIQEQQKIANFLCKIDDKLKKEKEKLDLLKQWKKGLLQKMFV